RGYFRAGTSRGERRGRGRRDGDRDDTFGRTGGPAAWYWRRIRADRQRRSGGPGARARHDGGWRLRLGGGQRAAGLAADRPARRAGVPAGLPWRPRAGGRVRPDRRLADRGAAQLLRQRVCAGHRGVSAGRHPAAGYDRQGGGWAVPGEAGKGVRLRGDRGGAPDDGTGPGGRKDGRGGELAAGWTAPGRASLGWLPGPAFAGIRPAETWGGVCSVDEEKAAVQGCLPYRQGFGVVGGSVPGLKALHTRKFHDDDAGTGWAVPFGNPR